MKRMAESGMGANRRIIIGILCSLVLFIPGAAGADTVLDDVLAALSHYDRVIQTLSVEVFERETTYIPASLRAGGVSGRPLELPAVAELAGVCYVKGPSVFIDKYGRNDLLGFYRGETFAIGPEGMIAVTHDYQPDEATKRGTVVLFAEVPDIYKNMFSNPLHWTTWFGTPLSEHLTDEHVRVESIAPITVGDERCYMIEFTKYDDYRYEVLVNSERGYRPQRMARINPVGNSWQLDVELEQYSDNVWYPALVTTRYFTPPDDQHPKGELKLERRIEFRDFQANIPIPDSNFEVSAEVMESGTYTKLDRR